VVCDLPLSWRWLLHLASNIGSWFIQPCDTRHIV
jgi:hypothetical protein